MKRYNYKIISGNYTIHSLIGMKYCDTTKPNGLPRKLQDVSKMEKLGWKYSVELEDGVKMSYKWYLENK